MRPVASQRARSWQSKSKRVAPSCSVASAAAPAPEWLAASSAARMWRKSGLRRAVPFAAGSAFAPGLKFEPWPAASALLSCYFARCRRRAKPGPEPSSENRPPVPCGFRSSLPLAWCTEIACRPDYIPRLHTQKPFSQLFCAKRTKRSQWLPYPRFCLAPRSRSLPSTRLDTGWFQVH